MTNARILTYDLSSSHFQGSNYKPSAPSSVLYIPHLILCASTCSQYTDLHNTSCFLHKNKIIRKKIEIQTKHTSTWIDYLYDVSVSWLTRIMFSPSYIFWIPYYYIVIILIVGYSLLRNLTECEFAWRVHKSDRVPLSTNPVLVLLKIPQFLFVFLICLSLIKIGTSVICSHPNCILQ